MTNIDRTSNSFFPKNKSDQTREAARLRKAVLNRNNIERKQALDISAKQDAKVNINDAIKDFSRIKKAVDVAPEIDKTDRIAELKAQIEAGKYSVDYEALADKILEQEF